jgi:peroxiredoxin (alkyl hydroperoxide reductase subunit C)
MAAPGRARKRIARMDDRALSALWKPTQRERVEMTIKVGDSMPAVKIMQATAEGPKEAAIAEIFAGKTVVLFGVPGAFTPTCSAKHLPGFVQHAAALKAKGVDVIACMSVNDAFVMGAWGKDQGITDEVMLLADGSADLTKAMGLELDLVARGLGLRCQRFALVAKDGKVTHVAVEAAGAFEVSKAEAVLAAL